jgi:hypothetical protein
MAKNQALVSTLPCPYLTGTWKEICYGVAMLSSTFSLALALFSAEINIPGKRVSSYEEKSVLETYKMCWNME